MAMLRHTQVIEAVAATNDQELASWVEQPGSYSIEPVPMSELEHHQLFRIMPDGVSHPMSVLIAVHTGSGQAAVTASNPEALSALLAAEPTLASSPELARRVFQLIREESRNQRLLRDAADLPEPLRAQALPVFAPVATRDHEGWTFRFAVLDAAGLLQHWEARIPVSGAASFEKRTVARDLDVGDMGP